ncbi:tetratricopeptide repeat protein [Limnohabitans sp. T6-5]|uniref:tetratricopeptide repeat protein n=1 Tax=Limnohabitans sp. T6-5 TaxID=1100724 RepID=UPI0011B24D05|nr:tetratricopeptide repeat protein [Limnohabitans sp. T6-5]
MKNYSYKIGLFGSSNCILVDGIASQFRKNNCDVLNLALGGSPTPSHIYQFLLNWDRLMECDFIVVEPSIIDLRFGGSAQGIELLKGYVNDFVSALRSLNKPFYLLDLPWPQTIKKASSASNVWRDAFNHYDGCVVDCYNAIDRLSVKYSIDDYSLFFRDDKGHHKPEFHSWIVKVLLNYHSAYMYDVSNKIYPVSNFKQKYGIISATSINGDFEALSRSTSLAAFDTVRLRPNKSYSINVNSKIEIIGLMGNFGEMSSNSISSTEWGSQGDYFTISHSNRYLTANPRGKLTLMFQTFPSGKLPISNGYTLKLSQDSSLDQQLEFVGFLFKFHGNFFESAIISSCVSNNSNKFSDFLASSVLSNSPYFNLSSKVNHAPNLNFEEMKADLVLSINQNFQNLSDINALARDFGLFFKKTRHLGIAASLFKGILEESPSSYWVRYNLVLVLLDIGDRESAILHAQPLLNSPDFSGRKEIIDYLKLD